MLSAFGGRELELFEWSLRSRSLRKRQAARRDHRGRKPKPTQSVASCSERSRPSFTSRPSTPRPEGSSPTNYSSLQRGGTATRASQRSLHNAPIFRLLLKVAVNGMHQCDFLNFCGALGLQPNKPYPARSAGSAAARLKRLASQQRAWRWSPFCSAALPRRLRSSRNHSGPNKLGELNRSRPLQRIPSRPFGYDQV